MIRHTRLVRWAATAVVIGLGACGSQAHSDRSTFTPRPQSSPTSGFTEDRWPWSSYAVAPDDRTPSLTVPSAGVCEQFSHAEIRYDNSPTVDGTQSVRVEVYAKYPSPPPRTGACLKPGETSTVRVMLDEPLGNREVTQRHRGLPPIPPDADSGSLPPAKPEPE